MSTNEILSLALLAVVFVVAVLFVLGFTGGCAGKVCGCGRGTRSV